MKNRDFLEQVFFWPPESLQSLSVRIVVQSTSRQHGDRTPESLHCCPINKLATWRPKRLQRENFERLPSNAPFFPRKLGARFSFLRPNLGGLIVRISYKEILGPLSATRVAQRTRCPIKGLWPSGRAVAARPGQARPLLTRILRTLFRAKNFDLNKFCSMPVKPRYPASQPDRLRFPLKRIRIS